jgi:hypothetical protein
MSEWNGCRKSSYSGPQGNCAEVKVMPGKQLLSPDDMGTDRETLIETEIAKVEDEFGWKVVAFFGHFIATTGELEIASSLERLKEKLIAREGPGDELLRPGPSAADVSWLANPGEPRRDPHGNPDRGPPHKHGTDRHRADDEMDTAGNGLGTTGGQAGGQQRG